MAATHLGSSDENAFWDAVGGSFVAALNEGLARARHSTLRSRGAGRLAARPEELEHPFAAAVMRAFEAALPAALAGEDQESMGLLAALRRRGQEMLVAALELTDRQGPVLSHGPVRPLAHGAVRSLLPRHEHLVVTLLMESAALVLSERPELGGTDGRPAALVRALGRRARSGGAGD
ncbi:hypothetical protein [Streptomyces sp. NPDC013457]|uniref:hypothetical protein n=1 Tax=Streptomyces sp. NPDC013457 TaxID=3364866 RepID=UPI0036FF840A